MIEVLMPWWKTAKFWLLVVAAVACSVIVFVLRGLFTKGPVSPSKPEDPGFGGLPPAPAALQNAADAAYEESLVVKADTKAATDAQKAELQRINAIADRKARRKALSDFSNRN